MPRPRGQNRQRLLDAGLEILRRQSFAASGVQEIADAAGVPKGSFYNYFDSKEDFGVAVLDAYRHDMCAQIAALLEQASGSPLARLEATLAAMAETAIAEGWETGCLAGNLSQELAGCDERFAHRLEDTFECMEGLFARCIEAGQEAGEIRRDFRPAELAGFLTQAWQGAGMRAKSARSSAPLEATTRILIDGLLRA